MSNDNFDKIPESVSISSDGANNNPDNSALDLSNQEYVGVRNLTPDELLLKLEEALVDSEELAQEFLNQLDKQRECLSIYIIDFILYIYHVFPFHT